ncbi:MULTISPECIES: methionine/alanine import family NSS transporter small subunit [Kytococcus]|uniref:Putative methionine/alanine importer small subunit n=1 Tax=Kytococcus schroeteri TaxID=138300 RepID=A0A2I1P953_9MICO|nr:MULTISPECIES: methionine/alanine import family NSS transporter small subunit [Kytococcus]PKZ41112.1 putative methionine/alanine importer small subunit [Kytococcus schroeteri]
MSTEAIVMMVVYLGVIWGGLGVSLAHLLANPDEESFGD